MKTNASPRSVIKAVENVSAAKYDNNVIFMKYPEKITKHVCRFILRTKDSKKPGSMTTKAGQVIPKVTWEVQQDVMEEILRLNPSPHIYVDTIYGRKFNENANSSAIVESLEKNSEARTENDEKNDEALQGEPVVQVRKKRKYTIRNPRKNAKSTKAATTNSGKFLIKALKYLSKHPELLEA